MGLFKKNEETNKIERVSLEAPWYSYCKKLQALFKLDKDIVVNDLCDTDDPDYNYVIYIEVKNHKKYEALSRLLSDGVTFGSVEVRIYIYDEENDGVENAGQIKLYETLFEDNPLVKDIRTVTDPAGVDHSYVRFQPEVIQFFDDNLQDYNGNWTGLAQDIAKEVFLGYPNINFCTADLREKQTTPLGEWP